MEGYAAGHGLSVLQLRRGGSMSRPLRIEIPGAIYNVMARGVNGISTFRDEEDYGEFLCLVACSLDRNGTNHEVNGVRPSQLIPLKNPLTVEAHIA